MNCSQQTVSNVEEPKVMSIEGAVHQSIDAIECCRCWCPDYRLGCSSGVPDVAKRMNGLRLLDHAGLTRTETLNAFDHYV